jgi:hypothetical protein
MKTVAKVVGLVQAKNEWPLLALSISHALMYHVDEVCVLNHSSTDGTFEGLQHLQKLWKSRIYVLNCNDQHYWQEALTNALIVMAQEASPDWIYVFDADEFLLTQGFRPLKEILDDVGPKYAVVRYEVQNWISTEDFDETRLDHYRMLRYRSVPNLFIDMHPETYADEIANDNLNFYDVPFPSKVIFKNNKASWLGAGAHVLKNPTDVHTLNLGADKLRVAHFSLITRERLEQKAIHGQQLIQNRFPATHGWQNQMIYKFSQENKLGQFWKRHTITPHNDSNDRTLLSFVIDDGFAQAIGPTVRLLKDGLDSMILERTREINLSCRKSDDTQIPFRTAVLLTRKFQLIADSTSSERDALLTERDALLTERNALRTERNALRTERDALRTERDALRTERDALLNSRSWRYTNFLRMILHYAGAGLRNTCVVIIRLLKERTIPRPRR